MTDFSIGQQIEEVEREIALREDVYKRKYTGRDKSRGEFHLARMRAVLKTLKWLRDNETDVRGYVIAKVEARKAKREACPDCVGTGRGSTTDPEAKCET